MSKVTLYHSATPRAWRFGKSKIREAKEKGTFAGEAARSEPRNQTSVRFRSGAMVKMPELVENIS
jgi:hypothetical protein